ncbi:hypothetical protein [Campylobacter jejuni]|nr:hypothetical protein [Campylobacter jejuni]
MAKIDFRAKNYKIFFMACISFRHKFSPVVLVLYEIIPYFYLTWV